MGTRMYRVRLFWAGEPRLTDEEGLTAFLDLDTPAGLEAAKRELNTLVVQLARRDRASDRNIPRYTLSVYEEDGVTWRLDWPAPNVVRH